MGGSGTGSGYPPGALLLLRTRQRLPAWTTGFLKHGRRSRRASSLCCLLGTLCSLASMALLVGPAVAPTPVALGPAVASASELPPPRTSSRIYEENLRPGTTAWMSPELSRALERPTSDLGALPSPFGASATSRMLVGPGGGTKPSQNWIDFEIKGYADQPSINRGEAINLYVSTTRPLYDMEVYRMGWYGGAGSRQVYVERGLPGQNQPVPAPDPSTGLTAVNWQVSRTLQTEADWVSGVYLVRLITTEGLFGYIIFVVRDDGRPADVLYNVPMATYQAYNNWGGKNLYDELSIGGRAFKVSFDRPYAQWNGAGGFFDGDYNMIRWLEKEGYDVTYATSLELQTGANVTAGRKIFLSNWHDEYWSKPMRDNLTAARDRGMHLAFFDANNIYNQIRFEPAADGRPNRVIVCYKQANIDPMSSTNPSLTTIPWRLPPVDQPENALLGIMYESHWDFGISFPWVVSNASHWAYEGTGLQNGESIPEMVGYEYDKVWDNGQTPAGLQVLSSSPVTDRNGVQGTANGAVYTAASGAIVFTAGTFYWAWKVDDNEIQQHGADSRVQRITANILNRMLASPTAAATAPTASAAITVPPSAAESLASTPSTAPAALPSPATAPSAMVPSARSATAPPAWWPVALLSVCCLPGGPLSPAGIGLLCYSAAWIVGRAWGDCLAVGTSLSLLVLATSLLTAVAYRRLAGARTEIMAR